MKRRIVAVALRVQEKYMKSNVFFLFQVFGNFGWVGDIASLEF